MLFRSSILSLLVCVLFFDLADSHAQCNYQYSGYLASAEASVHEHHDAVLDWGQCADSELCSVGREQSPINLDSRQALTSPELGRLEFESGKLSEMKMTWTGHNQVFYSTSHPENEPSSFLHKELREPFHLIQYHLHTPSEHTLDGVYYDAEIHLVHMNEAKNTLAVIGIFVQQGNKTSYSEFFETMIHEENHQHEHDETKFQDFDPTLFSKELLSSEYYHYKGSLTTPPCSEGVNWFVMSSPIFASPEQLQRLKLYQRHNSRPVQPLYERTLLFYPEEHSGVCELNGSETSDSLCGIVTPTVNFSSSSSQPTNSAREETHHIAQSIFEQPSGSSV